MLTGVKMIATMQEAKEVSELVLGKISSSLLGKDEDSIYILIDPLGNIHFNKDRKRYEMNNFKEIEPKMFLQLEKGTLSYALRQVNKAAEDFKKSMLSAISGLEHTKELEALPSLKEATFQVPLKDFEELDKLRAKYGTGNYICVVDFSDSRGYVKVHTSTFGNPLNKYVLIHNKHSNILEAYFRKEKIEYDVGSEDKAMWVTCSDFIESYHEDSRYRLAKNEFEINYGKTAFVGFTSKEFTCYKLMTEEAELDETLVSDGEFRKTEQLARRKARGDKERNRLEELVHWLEPDWEADWTNIEQEKAYTYYDHIAKNFSVTHGKYIKILGVIYMSRKTAEKICNELNNPTCDQTKELAEILKGN